MTTEFPAGWYPDYDDDRLLRYWDGLAWTSRTTLRVREEDGPPPPPPSATKLLRQPTNVTADKASGAGTKRGARAFSPLAARAARTWVGFERRVRAVPAYLRSRSRPKIIAVAAATVVIVVLAAGGIIYAVVLHNQDVAASKIAAAKAEAKAKAAEEQRQKEIAEVTAKRAHEDAVSSGTAQLVTSEKLYADSAAWGDPAARQELKVAIDGMKTLLATSDAASNAQLQDAYTRLINAGSKVGTLEAAQDRQYQALVDKGANSGRLITTAAGRDYCTYLDENYTPGNVFQMLWSSGSEVSAIDIAAVRVYCPKYQAAMDIALGAIFDGTHVEGKNGFTAGPWHTVGGVEDCYWELSDGHGNIADNNFINAAPSGVSIDVAPGQTLVTDGCKAWARG